MKLTKEVLEAIKAHNAHKPDACYNDNWNRAYKTGTLRARSLVRGALTFKYGICSGSMNHRRATVEVVADYVLYQSATFGWAMEASAEVQS